jgi:hypothetical protein
MKSFVRFYQKHNFLLLLIFIIVLAIIVYYVNKSNYLEGLTAREKHTFKSRKINHLTNKIKQCKANYYNNRLKTCPNYPNKNDESYIDCKGGLTHELNNNDFDYINMTYANGKCSSE